MQRNPCLSSIFAGTLFLLAGANLAQAADLSDVLDADNNPNVWEDDSNEYVFRASNGGFDAITTGPLAVGDLLIQIFDFSIINGTNIDSQGFEFTGLAVNSISELGAVGTALNSGGVSYDAYSFINFETATAAQWSGLTGIDITSLGFDETGLLSLLFEDPANNLDVNTQGLATTLTTATDGTLRLALGITDGDDRVQSFGSPEAIEQFLVGSPGVTTYGNFGYDLSPLYQNLPGFNVVSDIDGSGTNLTTDRSTIAPVINDTQFNLDVERRVPVPGTLLLMGAGLLGFARLRRADRS